MIIELRGLQVLWMQAGVTAAELDLVAAIPRGHPAAPLWMLPMLAGESSPMAALECIPWFFNCHSGVAPCSLLPHSSD